MGTVTFKMMPVSIAIGDHGNLFLTRSAATLGADENPNYGRLNGQCDATVGPSKYCKETKTVTNRIKLCDLPQWKADAKLNFKKDDIHIDDYESDVKVRSAVKGVECMPSYYLAAICPHVCLSTV